MAANAFLKCHMVTEVHEGGWSNHAADPGGATMYGITIGKYREHYPKATAADLRKITKENAREIYRRDFWNPINGETLHAGVDLAAYDASVNSGIGRGKKWLLASVGGTAEQTVKNICRKRLGFMQSLKIWKTFGKGWSRRVADIEAKGVAWALAAKSTKGVTRGTLERESKEAGKKAGQQVGAGGVVGGGGGAVTATPDVSDQLAAGSLVVAIVLIAVVAGFFIWRAKINKDRKDAYATEAAKL